MSDVGVLATPPLTTRALGAAGAFVALGLAALAGVGFAELARGEGVGLATLVGVVVARILLALALARFDDARARRARASARAALGARLLVWREPSGHGAGDLLDAVDDASNAEALERLRGAAAASLVGLVVVAISAGWLALAVAGVLLVVAVPLYRRAGSRAEAAQIAVRDRRERLEARQLEVLRHAPELRGLGAVEYGAREVGALSDREHEVALGAIRVALESSAVTEFLSGVSVGLVAMVVGFALLEGHLGLARALVAVLVTGELYVQVRRYGVEFHRREDARLALARLGVLAGAPTAPPSDGVAVRAIGLVTAARPEPVDLELGAGETLLVTGPSGAGKTTLLETLLGWRAPVAGALERGAGPVAVVSVDTPVLAASLRENLALGRALDDGALTAVLGELGLDGPRFSDLEAPLLPDGRGLSTGERVRLVLARGLLAGAELVVLDDVGGVLDDGARGRVRATLARRGDLAVVEATSGVAVLAAPRRRVELGP